VTLSHRCYTIAQFRQNMLVITLAEYVDTKLLVNCLVIGDFKNVSITLTSRNCKDLIEANKLHLTVCIYCL